MILLRDRRKHGQTTARNERKWGLAVSIIGFSLYIVIGESDDPLYSKTASREHMLRPPWA